MAVGTQSYIYSNRTQNLLYLATNLLTMLQGARRVIRHTFFYLYFFGEFLLKRWQYFRKIFGQFCNALRTRCIVRIIG